MLQNIYGCMNAHKAQQKQLVLFSFFRKVFFCDFRYLENSVLNLEHVQLSKLSKLFVLLENINLRAQ